MEILIGILLCLSMILLMMGIAIRREEKNRKVMAIVQGMTAQPSPQWYEKLLLSLANLLPALLSTDRVERNLRQAGYPFKWKNSTDVMIVRVILVVAFIALAASAQTNQFVIGVLGSVFGVMIPNWYIYNAKLMRHAKIRRQLRPFNMMLSQLVGTGIPMAEALHEAIATTSGEFRNLLEQMEKRMRIETLIEAFAWLSEEIGMKEVERLYTVVEQNKKNGTPLAELLNVMIEEYDQELENKIEKLSQKVNMKVTLVVLFLIVGPSILFDAIIAGINFMQEFNNF